MIVYKYRGGDDEAIKLHIKAIKNDYFWASDARSLNDPCENLFDSITFKNQLKGFIDRFPVDSAVNEKYVIFCNQLDNLLSRKIGIFSLSKTYNDELLWAHYANSHKGFCVGFDLDVLTKNLAVRKYYCYEVAYTESPPQLIIEDLNNLTGDLSKIGLLKKSIATKSKRWAYEEELRIISDKCGMQAYDFRALKSIYFGLRMEDSYKETIMSALKGRGVKYYQMAMMGNSYNFHHIELMDKYSDAEPYLYNISSVSENAVQEEDVSLDYKNYSPYLYKAIEVERRDPYCKHVRYAEFSLSKSSAQNPVVVVNCEKSNDDYENVFYTISQIDKLYAQITDL